MFLYTDEKLIKGLLEGKAACMEYIYREYFPMVRSIVTTQKGNLEDAEDIFHDGLIIVYNRLKSNTFSLNSSLKTYLFSVCRNIWKRRLERKFRLLYGTDMQDQSRSEPCSPEVAEEADAEKFRLFRKHLGDMPDFCRSLLTYYFQKIPLTVIAEKMNYKDAEYVKARKYYCKNLLRKKILCDPDCKQFMNYE